ncbi:MAG: potassium channel family protein [Methanoregula sp.]|nr:potassium channel family protein [Methanoregula sp.]
MKAINIRLRIYLAILAAVVIVGVLGLMAIEGFTPLDSFYFIIVTIATVGYGDIHPITPAGKILAILIILTGVGCFVGVVANAIEHVIDERERAERMKKLNMIIGVFFSEVGTPLIKRLNVHDPDVDRIRSALLVSNNWSDADFSKALTTIRDHEARLDSRTTSLLELHGFLAHHKGFMLALLENPQIFENDRFTNLLHAVFHLSEELIAREHLTGLPQADCDHLSEDLNRVYGQLIVEWLTYMQHLKIHYPYLFSLAMRTNPFDQNASPVVG